MPTSIEHIAIAARDPAALAHWYCDALGFSMLVAAAESQTYFVGLPNGGVVEIIAVDPASQDASTAHAAGLHHLALRVENFVQSAQDLQGRGVHFTGPAYGSPDGSTQFDFFCDPEGNRLQLVQRTHPLGS